MTRYLTLVHLAGEWLLDGGSTRRVCVGGRDLLEAFADTTRSEPPATIGEGEVLLEVETVRNGYVVAWRPDGATRSRSLIVRAGPDGDGGEASADRLWALLTERDPSLRGIVDRVEALGYGGAPNEALTVALGGDQLSVTRGQLRLFAKGLRVLRQIGKAVSISPKGGVA